MQYFFHFFLIKFIFLLFGVISIKTISFALDTKDREAFSLAFSRYYNKVLPKRIAVSSLYRAFVVDFITSPWVYVERFSEYDFRFPATANYETYTFRCDEKSKERFYETAGEVKPSTLLRCFTADFIKNPVFYINRFGGSNTTSTNTEITPLFFYGI